MRIARQLTTTGVTVALAVLVALAVAGAFGAGVASAGSGAVVWKKALNPTTKGDGLWLCASASGAMYACGQKGWPVGGGVTSSDVWVVKYRADGTRAWSRTWDGPDGLADEPYHVVADAQGNLFVAARTARTVGAWDSVVLKYSAGGTLKWATVYPAAASSDESDEARGIGLDAAGQVYVGGVAYNGTDTDWDIYVAKFDRLTGARAWTAWFDSGTYDSGWDLAVNGAGDSYFSGVTGRSPANNGLLVKVSAAGSVAWTKRWNGETSKDDAWHNVVLARSNGVFVAGEQDVLGPSDIAVARYEADGTLKWARTWTSNGSARDDVHNATVDAGGNLWVVGGIDRGSAGHRAVIGKWSNSGTRRFVRILGTKARPAQYYGVVTDGAGNGYAVGTVRSSLTRWNALAVSYSRGGSLRWRTGVTFGSTLREQYLEGVCLAPRGCVYSCGDARPVAEDYRGLVTKIRR